MSDPFFAPIAGTGAAKPAKATPDLVSVVPIPADAPLPPKRHPSHGKPAALWPYRDAGGALLGYAVRFNRPDGGKTFQPLTLFREVASGALRWKWKGWPDPRPLYGLDRLAGRPEATVLLCEGEKAADAAGELLPDLVAVTSPNGGKSAAKANWRPLRGRRVIVWPDADPAGTEYAEAATRLMLAAGAASVAQVTPPEGAAIGWDAADALADGWSPERVRDLVAAAGPVERPATAAPSVSIAPEAEAAAPGDDAGRRGPGRPSMQDVLLDLAAEYELWHTPKKDTYASMRVDGHRENWRLRSDAFVQRLRLRAHEATGRIPSKSNLEEVIGLLEARAIAYGQCQAEWLRVGRRDGNFYLDLGCDRWRAVEISARGAPRILESHSLPFVRPEGMQALPEPEFGSERGLDDLRPFVNVNSEADFQLIAAWVLASLCAADEFPLLILNGEQGTGKSTLSRLLRSIVDPHAATILAPPKEDRDLFVIAGHAHLLAFDNLSKVEGWLSDCLCSIATSGALAARSMYTDANLTILDATRPMILNGIPSLADRPDLAQRSITVRLRPVSEEERRASADIKRDWEAVRPRILGTFLEAIHTGLREVDRIKLDKLPRMAGFARMMVAAAPGLGLDGQALYDAYTANQSELASAAFENNPVANAVVAMMDKFSGEEWRGTPTELLAELSHPDHAPERVRNSFAWPKTPQAVGTAMSRIAPALRARGIDAKPQHSGKTYWVIRKL